MTYRGPLAILLAVALAGCQLGAAGVVAPKSTAKRTPAPKASAAPSAAPAKVAFAPLIEARRPIDPADLTAKTKLVAVELTGKAKLISDHGSGIVSNNSGGLISDHGSGLIANNGGGIVANNSGGLIANNGGGLTAKTKYALRQGGEAPAESSLAEATIEVLDGDGRVLVGKDGEPLGVATDRTGAFAFKGELPDENLVLRIRLNGALTAAGAGGQLLALLPRATGAGPRTVDLDTAASLGAAYVLETFVRKSAAVYAKLPAAEAEALRAEIEAARALVPAAEARTYKLADLVAATTALSAKARPVAARLEKIEALLIAGQANLGQGRPAREVALSTPAGVLGRPDGSLLIAESSAGRLRRVTPDQRMGLFLGLGVFFDGTKIVESQGDFLETPGAMVALPDGAILVADSIGGRVRKVTPDGRVATVIGTGQRKQGPVGGPGPETAIQGPRGLAVGPDGSVYVGEVPKLDVHGRIIRLHPDGRTEEIAPGATWDRAEIPALAVAADGTIYAADARTKRIHRRAPDGTWTDLDPDVLIGDYSDLQLLPDGGLLASAQDGHQIWRYDRDGKRTLVAGTGVGGFSGDGGPATAAQINRPSGLWVAPDGRIVFADQGNHLIREIRRDGTIATLAGATATDQVGDATNIAINQPTNVAVDPAGRLVIGEAAGDTIKRLEGGRLVKVAGAGKGLAGDGGPALQAMFNTLTAFAYAGDELYVIDSINERIRKIDAAGVVTTVVGAMNGGERQGMRRAALACSMGRPLALAIGPDGMPYWTDNEENLVCRLTKDGFVEVVAGIGNRGPGDAPDEPGPAQGGGLSSPVGLAFDAAGDLYVCDSGNLKIRKITGLASGAFTMSTWAGTGFAGALDLIGGKRPEDEGKPREQAVLIGPAAMTFGPDGAAYVAEAGTLRLATLGAMTGMDMSGLPRITARIRRIAPDGTVRTIAGPGTSLMADPASDDALITPLGLVFDREGRLVIADSGTNQVKVIPKGAF